MDLTIYVTTMISRNRFEHKLPKELFIRAFVYSTEQFWYINKILLQYIMHRSR